MAKQILVTGGAGFIGSHLCDSLLERGYHVRVLDNLSEQVHGQHLERPSYLNPEVELIVGDVRDKTAVEKALNKVDIVYHFAARVGVGQSMYEITDYTSVNNIGTTILLEEIIKRPVEKLVVASSMSIYGEGNYKRTNGAIVAGHQRSLEDLKRGNWELTDDSGEPLTPIPTRENKTPSLTSIYALSKYDQERLCLITGDAYGIPTVALRFFNVYGTRQALSNPYTGVLAIFASRFLNENPPLIYEDGNQMRDFIHVKDIVAACILASEKQEANGQVFNIGSGNAYTISEIANHLAEVMGKKHLRPTITRKYRAGDIRHCFSDITKARDILGFNPAINIHDGLAELTGWLATQTANDLVDMASKELEKRGLTV